MRKSSLRWFGIIVTALTVLGLVVLASASQPNSARHYHGNAWHYFIFQSAYVVVGAILALIIARIDYHIWKDRRLLTWIGYGVVFVLLLLVLKWFGGRAINGSYRWSKLGPINLQSSELAKLMIVITLAVWLDSLNWKVENFIKGAMIPGALIGAYAVPILAETDLGSTCVLGSAGLLVMWVAGTKLKHWLLMMVPVAAAIALVLIFNPNRMHRLGGWLGSGSDDEKPAKVSEMDSSTYQVYNSLVAIKRGGLTGVGYGQSMQKHRYLPEAHTDFIFAVGAEELGVGFSLGVIFLFAAFFGISVYIARHAVDRFGCYLVVGMSYIIFFPAMANLGVVCKALPTKGIALPFFSYGGTNMVCTFLAVGMIASVCLHSIRAGKGSVKLSAYLR